MSSRERTHKDILQEVKKLEQRVYEIFLDAGWNAKKNYRKIFKNNRIEMDVALFDSNEELVGAVDTKVISNPIIISHLKDLAALMLYRHEIRFFILFYDESAYLYTERGFIKLSDIPTPTNYQSMLERNPIELIEKPHSSHRPAEIHETDNNSPEMKQLLEIAKKYFSYPGIPGIHIKWSGDNTA